MYDISGFFSLFNGVGTHIDMQSNSVTLLKSDAALNSLFLTKFFRTPE